MSDYFIEQIKSGIIRCPKVFVATNNTQMFISEGSGLFDNINTYTKTSDSNFLGIEFLCRMFSQYPNELNNISNILLTNGSYLIDDNDNDSNPSLFVDPESINNHLEKLSMAGLEGKYLLPGQKMKIEGNIIGYDKASWIRLDAEQYEKYKKKICINKKDELCLKAPLFSKYSNDNKIESMLPMIEDELQNIAKLMLLCKMGALLVRTNKYLDTPLTPERLILNFRCANKTVRQYALNINTASFDYLPSTAEDLFKKYPFGIDIYIEDFIALLNGEIQIKELALANIKQWYIGDKISSPIAFLLNYFSIQQRGDLVYKLQ